MITSTAKAGGRAGRLAAIPQRITKLDLGFLLVRATLMVPVLAAARTYDEQALGEYSQTFHQLLIVSSVIVFGVHDRITVEREVNVKSEITGLGWRLLVLSPIVVLYEDRWFALATLVFLLLTRSGPMVLLAAARARGSTADYFLVCATVCLSNAVLCSGYALGLSSATTTIAAAAVMVPSVAAEWIRSPRSERRAFSPRRAFSGWDYCLNFLFTAMFSQGVLFLASFVTTAIEYAAVSRVMYLVQAGLLIQSVAYRTVLSLVTDGSIRLGQILTANALIGSGWFVAMLGAGGWIEGLLFGSRELPGYAYVLIGAIVLLQTFNLALAPYLIARGLVRRTLLVPAFSASAALMVAIGWGWIGSAYAIYVMIASVSVAGLVVRIVLVRKAEAVAHV